MALICLSVPDPHLPCPPFSQGVLSLLQGTYLSGPCLSLVFSRSPTSVTTCCSTRSLNFKSSKCLNKVHGKASLSSSWHWISCFWSVFRLHIFCGGLINANHAGSILYTTACKLSPYFVVFHLSFVICLASRVICWCVCRGAVGGRAARPVWHTALRAGQEGSGALQCRTCK